MLLLYLTVAWVVGILLGRFLWAQGVMGATAPALWVWISLCAVLIALALLLRRKRSLRVTLVLILFAVLGLWRYQSHPISPTFDPGDLAFYNSPDDDMVWVELVAVVDAYPDVHAQHTDYVVKVHTLEHNGQQIAVDGLALLQTNRYPEYDYGDELRVFGALTTAPVFEDFSYKEYLARKSIHSLVRYAKTERLSSGEGGRWRSALFRVRNHASTTIDRILPEPQASLLNGMLLGIESGIPGPLYDDFRDTGTVHLIVISGFNITVIAGLLSRLMLRVVGRRWAIYPVVAGIVVYALLAGAEPPVVRAAIMGILYVWAIHLGRETTAVVSLSAAALVLTAINPLALWDVGFQLSAAGTLGLISLSPRLTERSHDLIKARLATGWVRDSVLWLVDPLIVTVAAQVATLPILLAYFGRLSTVSLLSNLLIAAAQPPILILGGLALIAGLAWAPLGTAVGSLPWLLLAYTVEIVQLTARVPNATVDVGSVGVWFVWCYYGLLAGAAILASKWAALGQHARVAVRRAVTVTAVSLIVSWLGLALFSSLPDGLLHVWYIGLGDSDATLVRTPSRRSALISGGGGTRDVAPAIRRALGGWGHRLDLLILTRGQEETGDATESMLSSLRAERVLAPTSLGDSDLRQSGSGHNTWLVESLQPDMTIALGDDVALDVLCAPAGDDGCQNSLLRLTLGRLQLLLPSEIEQFAQRSLVESGQDLRSTILKTPHHGTGNWPTAPFLEAVRPQLILVPNNTTYPPASVDALSTRPLQYLDPLETIEIQSDGVAFWIERRWWQGGFRP